MNRILIALAAAFVALSGFSGDYVVKTWRTSLNADMDRIREVWASGSNSVRDVFKPWLRTCVGTNGQMQVFDEMHTTDLRDRRELRFYRNGELVGKQLYTNRIEVASVATAFKVETNRLAVAVSYSNDLGKVEFRWFNLSRDELLKPHDRDASGSTNLTLAAKAEKAFKKMQNGKDAAALRSAQIKKSMKEQAKKNAEKKDGKVYMKSGDIKGVGKSKIEGDTVVVTYADGTKKTHKLKRIRSGAILNVPEWDSSKKGEEKSITEEASGSGGGKGNGNGKGNGKGK